MPERRSRKGVFAMPAEDNKAVLRRMPYEAIGRGNLASMDELVAPDFVNHKVDVEHFRQEI